MPVGLLKNPAKQSNGNYDAVAEAEAVLAEAPVLV